MRALREHSESTLRAISEKSLSTQNIKIRVNTVGAYEYCLLSFKIALIQIDINNAGHFHHTPKFVLNIYINTTDINLVHDMEPIGRDKTQQRIW